VIPILPQATDTHFSPAVDEATAPSIDAGHLAALLAQIPSDRGSPLRDITSYNQRYPSRSPTLEPPEDSQWYEIRCYQALLDYGCRPLFDLGLLTAVETNPEAYHDLLKPWTRYPDESDAEDWMVFSRQLDRWKEFRIWRLRSRGKTANFSEYLEEHRRDWVREGGEPERTTRPDFEQSTRVLWKRDYDRGQPQLDGKDKDPEAVLSEYAEAVRELLMDHGLALPFQLHQDPKQQDQRATYVEYLAFECFWLGKRNKYARQLQRNLPRNEQKYQTIKAEADHLQRRVDWARSEITEIEAEQEAAGRNGSRSGGTRSRKRKLADDAGGAMEGVRRQAGKRRRTDETEKTVAGGSDNSRTARNKKRNLLADEDAPEPPAETRSRKRQKGTQKENDNAAGGRVLRSSLGAAVVSAVATHSQPRRQPQHERLKTLRPRVNGKVVSVVRGSKTSGGEARGRGQGSATTNLNAQDVKDLTIFHQEEDGSAEYGLRPIGHRMRL